MRRRLSPGIWLLLPVLLALLAGSAPAQLLDRLPRVFNRDDPPRDPRSLGSDPDITFVRDFGIPKPRSLRIQTLKGYEVNFQIAAETKTPGMTVEFLVRDFPTAGKLLALISNPENRSTAKVTYYADPDSAATMDSFTFVARYPGGKYSELARCDIRIEDAQPDIKVPGTLDFGKVMIGETAERELVLVNRGSGAFRRKVGLFSPWKMIEPADGQVDIAPGGRARLRLGFEPTYGGSAEYQFVLSRDDEGICTFRGEGEVPFSLSREEWELQTNPETNRREAEIVLLNHTPKPFEIFARGSPRLQTLFRESTVLIPGKENRIKVFLGEDDVHAFEGGIEFKVRSGYAARANVFADTVPAKLEIEIPGQLDNRVINFGKVTAGRSTERGILLTNRGGEILALDAAVEHPFRVIGNVDRQLGPLESLPLSIGFYPQRRDRGGADQFVVLRGNGVESRIRVMGIALRPPDAPRGPMSLPDAVVTTTPDSGTTSATVPGADAPIPEVSSPPTRIGSPDSAPPAAASSPEDEWPERDMAAPWYEGSSPEEIQAAMSPLGIATRGIVERERAPGLKSAEDFELLGASAKSLEFSWTAPKGSEIDTFELEMRGEMINPITQMPESVWAPYPAVEYERVGRLVKARVNRLRPSRFYEFRVFTIDANGRSSPPSVAFGTMTDAPLDWTFIYVGLGVFLTGLLGWGGFTVVRARFVNEEG